MLYITTRDEKDAYTAHRALNYETAPDGGWFVPFRMPHYSEADLMKLGDMSFSQIVADMLNHFFSLHLTGWDIEVAMGKNFAKLVPVNHRGIVAEVWHNFGTTFESAVSSLHTTYCTEQGSVSDWLSIAVRIATIFGAYGRMLQQGQSHKQDQSSDHCDKQIGISGLQGTRSLLMHDPGKAGHGQDLEENESRHQISREHDALRCS